MYIKRTHTHTHSKETEIDLRVQHHHTVNDHTNTVGVATQCTVTKLIHFTEKLTRSWTGVGWG